MAKAKTGNRMIQVNVLFWTNDIADAPNTLVPKHAWSGGVVRLEKNDAHGIGPGQEAFFHSPMDLTAQIEKLILANGIVLHPGRRMRRYISTTSVAAETLKKRGGNREQAK